MAVNDVYTLPKKVVAIPQMYDLLQTEQKEIDSIVNYIDETLKELNVNSSTKLINRHEKIFGLENSTNNTTAERRAKIIAKLNNRGITTVESIEEISKILTDRDCFVTESFSDYSFIINIKFLPSSELKKIDYLLVQVDEIKPAHLNCVIHLVYNQYKTFEPFMYKELSKFTHLELREKHINSDDYLRKHGEIKTVATRLTYGELRRKGQWHT